MRVLFVNTNRNRLLTPPPVGAMLVADHLRRDGHEMRFVDLMHSKRPKEDLASAVARHRPEFLCFSVRNRDNQDMGDFDDPLPEIRELVEHTRALCDAPSLIGGSAVTTFPRQLRSALAVDYAFAGDDPDLIARFLASIEAGDLDTGVAGLVYEESGEVHVNPPRLRGYRGLRFGGYDMLDMKAYRKGYYDCGVVTQTGCPLGCVFCDAHTTFGRSYVLRDPGDVIDELRELKQVYRAKSVWLVNAGINRPLEYGKELMARIAESQVDLPFACIIEPGEFDADLARMLKKAGCQLVMLFGSTLCDRVLVQNGSHYRCDDIFDAARFLGEARLPYMLGLLFGQPGESVQSVEESLKKSLEIKPVFTQYGVGLRVQPDTPLREIAVEEGIIEADDDCFQASFYCSPEAPPDKLWKRIRRFKRMHPWHRLRMVSYVSRTTWESVSRRG
jgi:radical SAM superfamily enzyme YgiQ (UPF0313 family)